MFGEIKSKFNAFATFLNTSELLDNLCDPLVLSSCPNWHRPIKSFVLHMITIFTHFASTGTCISTQNGYHWDDVEIFYLCRLSLLDLPQLFLFHSLQFPRVRDLKSREN